MPKYELIVIGAGTSALNYLYALLKTAGPKSYSIAEAEKGFGKGTVPASVMQKLSGNFPKTTLVIGESDLWEKAGEFNPGYRVGQTSDHVRTPDSTRPVGSDTSFRPVSEYVSEMKSLRGTVEKGAKSIGAAISFLRGQVKKVSEDADGYSVKVLASPVDYTCAKVILASGAGPTLLSDPLKLENIKNKDRLKNRRDYEELIGGTEYLYSQAPKHNDVLVYGGAPTSAWVVARARQHYCKVLWVARSGWDGANPAGRNKEVIEWAAKNKVMVKADIASVEVIVPP